MLLHALRTARPTDRQRGIRILAQPRPSAGTTVRDLRLLDELVATGELSPTGRMRLLSSMDGSGFEETKTLEDIRWLYEQMQRAGSLEHARKVADRQADEAGVVLAGLDWFPGSRHRDVLRDLVDYVHERTR